MHWDCNGKNTPTKEEETEREKKLIQRWHYTAKEEEEDGKAMEGCKEKSTVKVLQRTPSKKRKKKE